MATRYVILAHRGYGKDHLDLMIQQPQSLATWQIDDAPLPELLSSAVEARRIQDHRLAYLEYQGPVSGGRGEVARVDEGRCEVLLAGDDLLEVSFTGRVLRGTLRFSRRSESWVIEPIGQPAKVKSE